MTIDLRSDTLTKPGKSMLEAMFNAELGDDVYGEDPSINKFEKEVADYFGKEKAVFCPSGTMANQIGLRLLTQPQDEIICDEKSHIYRYEGGGIFYNSLCSVKLLKSDYGILNAEQIEKEINPRDVHFPRTKVIALENTCNKGGGSYYKLNEIKSIKNLADKYSLKMHLDGARLFNALIASEINPIELANKFDTISICFSKGLGCPIGSVILIDEAMEYDARRYRKVMGGGMRQAGILAAAASYALKNNIERLKEDHLRCDKIADALEKNNLIKKIYPHPTNILLFELENSDMASRFKSYLESNNVLISAFDSNTLRIVTHMDIDKEMMARVIELIQEWKN
ncbi:aminotransferase class I/II-fold pyridoxal phosphate-dependent enzyme [Hyphobacterium sp. CCMP332]|nr:aminotransferase class I/II-fold pyridoxal phosphate-dependent enzyme [Hyphobacterium sp. CCMP332]